jgi:uncharacterized protein (DUF1684 family)
MQKSFIFFLFLVYFLPSFCQDLSYADSINTYRSKYVKEHEVVKGSDKKQMSFFPVDGNYRVNARVELIEDAPWFSMETSSDKKKPYRLYAILHFSLNNKELKLHIYQSKDLMKIAEYEDHLFIPFIDETCGEDSYENGRYIDLTIPDIAQGTFLLDFNKAYNPYCAYISNKYSCPVPPKENILPVSINAGEKKFKAH